MAHRRQARARMDTGSLQHAVTVRQHGVVRWGRVEESGVAGGRCVQLAGHARLLPRQLVALAAQHVLNLHGGLMFKWVGWPWLALAGLGWPWAERTAALHGLQLARGSPMNCQMS